VVVACLFFRNAGALQVIPGYQILSVEPGKETIAEIKITNSEDEDLQITPASKDWFVLPENKDFKAEDWLKTKEKSFALKKGETRVVRYTVTAPKKAVGELVGMATFESQGSSQMMVMKVSVAVYAVMKGTEKYNNVIEGIVVEPSANTLKAGVMLKNTGNIHMRVEGFVQMFDAKNQLIAVIQIDRGNPVYPGKTGLFYGTIKDFSIGPGRYAVQASLVDVDQHITITSETKNFELKKMEKVLVQ
jgi:hypothetical protein